MRAWLREPLLHFLAIGAAIFLLYRLVGGEQQGPREIVVSEARIESLAESFPRLDAAADGRRDPRARR